MDEKLLDPPSVYCVPKGTGHSGLIPPSHFETRRVPAYSAPPWAELAQLRRENVELRGKQENNEGARARSRERDPPEAPPSESRALEIIAHQMREIRRLEGALADAQEREGELRGAAQEAHELRRAQSEGEHAEERRRRAEEAAARHRQEELAMMSERHKMEAETLRSRVQALEAEQRERREKQAQEMTCLRGELRVANQDKETLVEELGQSRLELDSQNSLVQQLRTYIGELVPDNKRVEEQKRERMELQSTIETLEKERESLQTSACLLHTRLSSLTHILSLQEGELCKKGVPGEGERSRLLLSQWREKVFSLMVQLKSEEINKENGSRKIREKILSLEHSLEASGQQQNILLHTLQDRTAELDMERVRSKSLQGELSDRNTTSARLHSRAGKAEQALLHLKQMIDGSVQALSAQDVSLRAALSRLVTLGQRVTFATKRVDTIQGLVAQRFALVRLTQEERRRDIVTGGDICRPSYEDLETEVTLLHEERDRLCAELKRSALLIERSVTETRERLEAELAECQHTTSHLRQSLHETEESEREVRGRLGETERRLQEASESAAQLREQLQEQEGEYEKALQGRVSEVEEKMLQQLSQMEKHLHEARREHTKAVVALRQAERQTQREKTRSRETLRALEDAARTEEEQLGRRLQEAERDKNLMTATLRQEGLMKAYQRNRSAAVPVPDRESEHGQSPTEAQTLVPTSAHPAKESLSSMLANLQSLGAALLSDEEEGERLNL